MKEIYESPELTITYFELSDIITASEGGPGENFVDPGDFE